MGIVTLQCSCCGERRSVDAERRYRQEYQKKKQSKTGIGVTAVFRRMNTCWRQELDK